MEETHIPVTDEGLLRGDGGFEVARLYGGRPFANGRPLRAPGAHLQRAATGVRPRRAARRGRRAGGGGTGRRRRCCGSCSTRGGRRIAMIEPLPPTAATARVATITYAPTRVLNGLKTLSYAANMLAGRLAKEQGADEALLVTPHGRVLEGPTWTFFWVRTAGRSRRRWRTGSSPRSRATAAGGVRGDEAACTLDDVRAAEEAFIASTVREVMPIAAVDEIELPRRRVRSPRRARGGSRRARGPPGPSGSRAWAPAPGTPRTRARCREATSALPRAASCQLATSPSFAES